jgi:hypothetical protein
MPLCLIFLFSVSTIQAQTPQDSWKNLSLLTATQDIELVDMAQHWRQGRFVNYSQDTITMVSGGKEVSIPRADVCQVSILERSNTKRILLGTLAGGAIFAGLGAIVGGGGTNDTPMKKDFVTQFALVGASTGASMGVSYSAPRRVQVYMGQCHVDYRPDFRLPILGLYSGYSRASIQTGAAPANGFELGIPGPARQYQSGFNISFFVSVSENLRFLVIHGAEYFGDSGLSGLSLPARRADTYRLFGPEFITRKKKWMIFSHILAGSQDSTLTFPVEDLQGIHAYQLVHDIGETEVNSYDGGPAMMIGGGAEYTLSRWLAIRPAQIDYMTSRVKRGNFVSTAAGPNYSDSWQQHNWSIGAGAAFHLAPSNQGIVVHDSRRPVASKAPLQPQAPPPQTAPSAREGSRWSVHGLLGFAPNASGGDLGPNPNGNPGRNLCCVTTKDPAAYELDVDYDISKFFVRAGYQWANLDFGSDYYTENPNTVDIKISSIPIATARYHMPKFGLFYALGSGHCCMSLNFGAIAGPAYLTNIKPTTPASDPLGIQQITSEGRFGYGGEMEARYRLGHTGISLGASMSVIFGGGAQLNIETAPDSSYASGSIGYRPVVIALTANYRFP